MRIPTNRITSVACGTVDIYPTLLDIVGADIHEDDQPRLDGISILSLIDGKRSLKDMAETMESQRLMPAKEAEAAIRGFLIKMFEEASSGRSY